MNNMTREVIVERDKLKKELEQERFNHSNTRRSWDATLTANSFHKKAAEDALAEQYRLQKENERLKEEIDKMYKGYRFKKV